MLEQWINTVQQGDCLELMKQLPDKCIDLVLTDPPYGIDFQSSWTTEWRRKDKIANDERPFTDFLPELPRIMKDGAVLLCFTRWDVENEFREKIASVGLDLYGQIIWDKIMHGMGNLTGDVAPQHENIIFARKAGEYKFPGLRPKSIIKALRVPADKLQHPNEKPVHLITRLLLSFLRPPGLVLDCFMGSGATGRACKDIGVDFIGMEIEPKYVEIANKRLEQEVLL